MVRILGILGTLLEGGQPSIAQLAARFGTRRETIYRDIRALEDAGYPIAGDDRGRLSHPRLLPEARRHTPNLRLNDAEITALLWASSQASSKSPFRDTLVAVALLKKTPTCRVVLVEKTDRLYRNLKDWVIIDELGLEIHFVKENVVLSPESRSSEKFMHGIQVLMARNYILNLGEEAKKGQQEKARQGIWPSFAPLGCINVGGPNGKRIVKIDPSLAPAIARIFEQYATGNYSLKQIAKQARADGQAYRKSGDAVPTSTVHRILRKRIYCGDFDFNGTTYHGTHDAIVSRELWEQVQAVLDGHNARKLTRSRRSSRSPV